MMKKREEKGKQVVDQERGKKREKGRGRGEKERRSK